MAYTYLFYDLETTGLNKAFDQVLQFAAIRTDEQFNELETHEIHIKLRPDVIPSAQALITHQIDWQDLVDAQSEYEGIKYIHTLLNAPNTVSLGYNTLGFDDEFLRFSFYRNLLTPYTHQYANGCRRMDIYPILQFFWLFKPDVLNWPDIDGKPSLRLEHMSKLNNLADGPAHDAMVDVRATVALAKCLAKEKSMWQYCTEYFDKLTDKERIFKLPITLTEAQSGLREGLMILGRFGYGQYCQAPVLYLGEHKSYKNQCVWLRLDDENLSKTNKDNIAEQPWVVTKKYAEPGFVLPLSERYGKHLTENRLHVVDKNKQWLSSNGGLLHSICEHYLTCTYPDIANIDDDAALYQLGFWSDRDLNFCKQFHMASPEHRHDLVTYFSNQTLQDLAIRILGRNYPDSLSAEQHQVFNEHLHRVWSEQPDTVDYRDQPRLQASQELAEIAELLKQPEQLNQQQLSLLGKLKTYIEKNMSV